MKQNDSEAVLKVPKSSLKQLFPSLHFSAVVAPNMSSNSNFFGDDPQHEDLTIAAKRLENFQNQHPNALLANGYLEQREFYNTPNFERTINGKLEYRNIHLGTDFWVPADTPVHAIFDGKVVISNDNNFHKDYGPTIVLEHNINDQRFYTLYGHLSKESLNISKNGTSIKKGTCIGFIGDPKENGHWLPHLHLQVITDLLGETKNFNGVAFPSEIEKWKTICPNPNLLFIEKLPSTSEY